MIYFAYGSNLYSRQMKSRCPSAEFIARVKLVGYKLGFTKYSAKRKGGVADIIKDTNHEVWGVIYEISDPEDWNRLDRYEGVNIGNYARIEISVINDDNIMINATSYSIVSKEHNFIMPSEKYLNTILRGAREHNLPKNYVQRIALTSINERIKESKQTPESRS